MFFKTVVLRKLFDITFSYKHCNFSRVCLLSSSRWRRKLWQGLLPQGQSKLSVIMRCSFYPGVHEAGFDYIRWTPLWNALALQLHADLSVYFRNGHNRWILYPEGSIYYSRLSLRECLFWLSSKKVRFYGGRLRSKLKGIEQWHN